MLGGVSGGGVPARPRAIGRGDARPTGLLGGVDVVVVVGRGDIGPRPRGRQQAQCQPNAVTISTSAGARGWWWRHHGWECSGRDKGRQR